MTQRRAEKREPSDERERELELELNVETIKDLDPGLETETEIRGGAARPWSATCSD